VDGHFGLTPRQYQSGETDHSGAIAKTGDVLAYLRGGHGGEAIQPLAVTALVRTVADELTDAGTPVEEGRMDEEAVVSGRRVAIKRAVTNLLANAVRHGQDPWVEVEALSDAVLVRVGDYGPGIPPEDLPRVTEPFFRGDRARTVGGGSGLGLATAKAIVEGHGGSLAIDSTPNRGTVVILRLPRGLHANGSGAAGTMRQSGTGAARSPLGKAGQA
jgi:signal transduction histidine kinase